MSKIRNRVSLGKMSERRTDERCRALNDSEDVSEESCAGDKSIVLIGDGWMAQEALAMLEKHPRVTIPIVIHHVSPAHGFRRLRPIDVKNPDKLCECDNVNDSHVVSRLLQLKPDLMLSVNNFDIIRDPVLEIPNDGIINFHNGPLPSYRGLNIPSWAIFNGETRHAVTWHFIGRDVDSGSVVRESWFKISDDETAISLIFKCIQEGLRILPGLIDSYLDNTLAVRSQGSNGRYYSARDFPNDGVIKFSMNAQMINRIVRALSFHPFPNRFIAAHFIAPGGKVCVGRVSRSDAGSDGESKPPGYVAEVGEGSLLVRCKDGWITLEYLTDTEGFSLSKQRIGKSFGLRKGKII